MQTCGYRLPNFVSHFNDNDGIGDCTIGQKAQSASRRVGKPSDDAGDPFWLDDWYSPAYTTARAVVKGMCNKSRI